MASLSLRHLTKVYPGGVRAVNDFELEIEDKEFIVFVGPSGSGKSTALRMISGLEQITSGELYIDGELMNDVQPKDRDIAMVFQSYSLYPHLTVYDNMAYGLRIRHYPQEYVDKKVKEAAEVLGVTHLLARRPKTLSGGQRQRVALGRAIVREPKVFLLDEPLSNLDAKLRVQMRTEITKLHDRLDTTFIYVTHDQTEAMTMGTRIVVMKEGTIQQVDTPAVLYDNPANLFVACFLGSPQMNIFKARLRQEGDELYALIGNSGKVLIPKSRRRRLNRSDVSGMDVLLGIRPEDVHYEQSLVDAHPDCVIDAKVDVIENLGNETILYLNVEGKTDYTVARVNSRYGFSQGDSIKVYLATDHAHLFDPVTERTLIGVPDHNMLHATLTADGGALTVGFGDVSLALPDSVTERLIDTSVVNGDVLLAIPPHAFKCRRDGDSDVAIEGEVEFYDSLPRANAVYVKVKGVDGYVLFLRPTEEELSCGQKICGYVDPACVELFDTEGERVTTKRPVTYNRTAGEVTENKGRTTFKLRDRSSKLKMSYNGTLDIQKGEDVKLYVKPTGFILDRLEIAKAPKLSMAATILDIENYRSRAVLTLLAPAFADPITAVIKGFSGYNVGDKVKLGIDPGAIVSGECETNMDRIAKLSK